MIRSRNPKNVSNIKFIGILDNQLRIYYTRIKKQVCERNGDCDNIKTNHDGGV